MWSFECTGNPCRRLSPEGSKKSNWDLFQIQPLALTLKTPQCDKTSMQICTNQKWLAISDVFIDGSARRMFVLSMELQTNPWHPSHRQEFCNCRENLLARILARGLRVIFQLYITLCKRLQKCSEQKKISKWAQNPGSTPGLNYSQFQGKGNGVDPAPLRKPNTIQ